MIDITAFRRVCLARMVIPVGNRRDGPTEPTSWTWLPANKANEIQIDIPVKLIEEILARKRAQFASAPPTPPTTVKPSRPPRPLQLLLARVVLPVKPPPRPQELKSAPDEGERLTPKQSSDVEEIRKRLLTAAFGVMNVRTARDKPPVKGETKMPTFTIDDDNNITVFNSAQDAAQADDSTATRFDSQAALRKVSAAWPLSRLIDIWNSIPGQREVHTFTHRGKAVARIWKAIQALGKNGSASKKEAVPKETSKKKAPRKRRGAKRAPTVKKVAKDSERSNKKAAVIAMMKRAKGATLPEIMQATSWQAHTVRGFVSILGSKGGQKISSSKNAAGERTYRIAK
jgi:Protein of unknown function (DUF3489)